MCLEGPFAQVSGNGSYPEGVEEGDLGALLFLQHTKNAPINSPRLLALNLGIFRVTRTENRASCQDCPECWLPALSLTYQVEVRGSWAD